jgi:hypothetical protein
LFLLLIAMSSLRSSSSWASPPRPPKGAAMVVGVDFVKK